MGEPIVAHRNVTTIDRRNWCRGGAALLATSLIAPQRALSRATAPEPAQIAITLDLEMSRNFPTWESTEWDYQKGNLDDAAKRYSVACCRRVAERGGRIHTFVVGQVFEQSNVDWLRDIAAAGHPIGNHTYDHVYLLAQQRDEIQFRFRRAPWLLGERPISEILRDNIRLCSMAIRDRVDVAPRGFRTPGGFANGLHGRQDIQAMLLDLGFRWVSCTYPAHAGIESLYGTFQRPSQDAYDNIVAAQSVAQPFFYPSGLLDIPMSPISDIGAFRSGRWKLEYFLDAIRIAIEWAIEHGGVYDFLAHPSCLGVVDPHFRAIDLICDLVEQSNGRAKLVTLDEIAEQAFAHRDGCASK